MIIFFFSIFYIERLFKFDIDDEIDVNFVGKFLGYSIFDMFGVWIIDLGVIDYMIVYLKMVKYLKFFI